MSRQASYAIGGVIAALIFIPLTAWARKSGNGMVALAIAAVIALAICAVIRIKTGCWPGDEHRLMMSAAERRRTTINGLGILVVMAALCVGMIIYVDGTAKPERKVLQQLSDYWSGAR